MAEGSDILYPANHFAYNRSLLLRPELFAAIWRPHYEPILAPITAAGAPIWFHSDGKLDDAMEMLIDTGINCITPMDPTGIDYRDYNCRYGDRVTLHGNIDIEYPLVRGTPDDVDRDVREHMDGLRPGGRCIAGSSHSIVNYSRTGISSR